MNFLQKLKILPVLVFVAMLAFSVRLAEVVSGVTHLSQSAYAESSYGGGQDKNKKEKMASDMKSKEGKDKDMASKEMSSKKSSNKLVFAEGDSAGKDKSKKGKKKAAQSDDDLEIDWRAQGEEDLNYTETRMELFKDLSKRRDEIESRESELHTKEALLKAAERELDRKYQELAQLRREIEKLLEQQSEEEQARINSLVKIYEGMKPKDAARIFDTLDIDILVNVASRMSERRLSPILASMKPERVRTVTIMLAEEKQLPSLPQTR